MALLKTFKHEADVESERGKALLKIMDDMKSDNVFIKSDMEVISDNINDLKVLLGVLRSETDTINNNMLNIDQTITNTSRETMQLLQLLKEQLPSSSSTPKP
ncbi:hypothetical protein Droror1_Dr00023446 [Drosera rotundifolia]